MRNEQLKFSKNIRFLHLSFLSFVSFLSFNPS